MILKLCKDLILLHGEIPETAQICKQYKDMLVRENYIYMVLLTVFDDANFGDCNQAQGDDTY